VKALYQSHGIDSHGGDKYFEKPLFMTFVMFFGMAFALPLYYAIVYFSKRNKSSASGRESVPLVPKNDTPVSLSLKSHSDANRYSQEDPFDDYGSVAASYQLTVTSPEEEESNDASVLEDPRALLDWSLNLMLLIPSFFDLLGSALSTIGLMYTSVSVYQLSRCSVIIVTAILKSSVLGHKLSRRMWTGVGVITLAMTLVGATAFFDASDDAAGTGEAAGAASNAKLGMIFILASCLVQGAQYVFEESMLTLENVPPLILVGMEGFWGVVLCLFCVFPLAHLLPGSDNGIYEDIPDALYMAMHNTEILTLVIAFCLIVFLYNVFCIYITFLLNSIWHAIMDNCRPVAVWSCGLILYYTTGRVGEPWTNSSWLELAGMLLLFYGTAVYNGNVSFPGVHDEDAAEAEEAPLPYHDTLPSTPMFHPKNSSGPLPSASLMMTQSPSMRALNHGHSHGHGHGHSHGLGANPYADSKNPLVGAL